MKNKEKLNSAVVLLSGGLDSSTCLYLANDLHDKVYALSFDYGQRHSIELKKSKILAKLVQAEHYIIKIQTGLFQGTSLVNHHIQVPKNQISKTVKSITSHKKISQDKENKASEQPIPNTYVPGRNILFLSYALSFAESRQASSIYIGVNALDYSGYPDCRPDFIKSYQKMLGYGTKAGVEGQPIQIITPLINMTKKEIILLGSELNVPFDKTISCYDPDPKTGKPCGECDSCILREKGFREAGVKQSS
ncbi:7-cyano-7-deazaguanine synthase QueC [Leptospira sp. GIMC2001]|nr:7-cyano-7-deazaguanine synthase QueC [Leptospira sp. GIMC2001]WCL49665.1 7-cyano-7-deazaguanine synthase QueC [Leptospira sp. GIMC2001]